MPGAGLGLGEWKREGGGRCRLGCVRIRRPRRSAQFTTSSAMNSSSPSLTALGQSWRGVGVR